MKLKTLKDIEIKPIAIRSGSVVDFLELKQEAIKEIKLLQKAVEETEPVPKFLHPYLHVEDWKAHLQSIITYIMWKFNITEKGLK